MHWNAAFARQGKVNALVEGRCDPVSGQPESKQTAVRIMPWQPAWQGELYARALPELPPSAHGWRKASRLTVAGDTPLFSWVADYARARGWQLQIAQTDPHALPVQQRMARSRRRGWRLKSGLDDRMRQRR